MREETMRNRIKKMEDDIRLKKEEYYEKLGIETKESKASNKNHLLP